MSTNGDAIGDVKGPEPSSTAKPSFIDTNLISLKCLLFFFFGGIGCLVPFYPLHMLSLGLSDYETHLIMTVAPAVSIIGPLIVGPLADRMAASRLRRQQARTAAGEKSKEDHGMYLRVMIAVCCVFSAFFYGLLLLVPSVQRIELPDELRPAVKFSCDEHGAIVYQERCIDTIGCHRWTNEELVGAMRLVNCEYACQPPEEKKRRRGQLPPLQPESRRSEIPKMVSSTPAAVKSLDDSMMDDGSGDLNVLPLETTMASKLEQPEIGDKAKRRVLPKSESPHVCYHDGLGRPICHVFTEPRSNLLINASLRQALNPEELDEWCAYPVAQHFMCRIPSELSEPMAKINQTCHVECQFEEPYDVHYVPPGSRNVLAESQCRRVIGNEQLTFWMYLVIRSLSDIFPCAAVALLHAAMVIATRETSTGRGDVGRQCAFGALGFATFGPICGFILKRFGPIPSFYAPMVIHIIVNLIAACIALSARGMPLNPPEWWWHSRSGILASPVNGVRRYGGEAVSLFIIIVLTGTLWSAIDSYLSVHLIHLNADEMAVGLILTIGALPAIVFFWNSEYLVDYFGHSNLFILSFVMYIVRFACLSVIPNVWWTLAAEALELFTFEIAWITGVLYFRHLMPRQMTMTGQALPVIAHFGIGRSLGAAVGVFADKIDQYDEVKAMRYVYQCLAIVSAIIASLYFVLYHGILKPRCHAQTNQAGHKQPLTVVQAMNGNGNYTPLRVYHNGTGRKGEFRY